MCLQVEANFLLTPSEEKRGLGAASGAAGVSEVCYEPCSFRNHWLCIILLGEDMVLPQGGPAELMQPSCILGMQNNQLGCLEQSDAAHAQST